MSATAASAISDVRLLPQEVLHASYLDGHVLAWLVLAPVWPEGIARRVFPACSTYLESAETVMEMLGASTRSGLLMSIPGQTPWRGRWYMLKPTLQERAVQYLLKTARNGITFLELELKRLGNQLRTPDVHGYPPALECFAEFARSASDGPGPCDAAMARVLEAKVREALALGRKEGAVSFPAADRWIEAAQPLAYIFGGALRVETERARRRVELSERRGRDRRYLDNYTERRTLQDAFTAMLDPRADESWALHYVGDGGMGKTMLIRKITGPGADDQKLVTSRIDFDHINPDYPSRAPGLLLLALAEELKLYEGTEISPYLEKFDDVINEAQKGFEAAIQAGALPGAEILRQLKEAEDRFVEILQTISRTRRVVLILDTCEELARIRSDGTPSDAVIKTFEVLERIHSQVKSMRVVFSGRRNLASAGFGGWSAPESKLDPKKYLRRIEVKGFSKDESERFFDNYGKGQKPVPADLRKKILELSNLDKSAPTLDVALFNPYDLNLYASWVSDNPGDAQVLLEAGSHYYVQERIIGRLNDWIRPWLPFLAVLGEFDAKLLRRLIDEPEEQFKNIENEITALEWVHRSYGAQWDGESPDVLRVVWYVDRQIATRLINFYTDQEDGLKDWPRVLATLRSVMIREVIDRPWSELVIEYFLVALQLMATTSEAAVAWWREVEAKIAREDRIAWGLQICRAFRSREWDNISPLADREWTRVVWAMLGATEAALRTRLGTEGFELKSIWSGVVDLLQNVEQTPEVQRLLYRAYVGISSSQRWIAGPIPGQVANELKDEIWEVPPIPDSPDEELIGTEIGFIDNLVEIVDTQDAYDLVSDAHRTLVDQRINALHIAAKALPQSLAAFLTCRRARLAHLAMKDLEVRDWPLGQISGEFTDWRNLFLDWRGPEDPGSRMTAELARTVRWSTSPDNEYLLGVFLVSKNVLPSDLQTIDGDRKASIMLRWLADYLLPDEPSEAAIDMSIELASRAVPACAAHRQIPPYFQTALEVLADRGQGHRVLQKCNALAHDSTRGIAVQRAAERIKAYVATRWRVAELGVARDSSLVNSPHFEDRALAVGVQAFDTPHYVVRETGAAFATRWITALDRHDPDPDTQVTLADRINCELDLVMNSPGGASTSGDRKRLSRGFDKPRPLADSVTGIRALLRAWALGIGPEPKLTCGPRLAASIALEEGSLLALGQPDLAARLLEYAGLKYDLAKDPMGQLLTAATVALLPADLGAAQLMANLDEKIKRAKTALGLHAGLVMDPHVLSKRETHDPAASEMDFWQPWRFRFEIARLGSKAAAIFSDASPPPPDLAHLATTPESPRVNVLPALESISRRTMTIGLTAFLVAVALGAVWYSEGIGDGGPEDSPFIPWESVVQLAVAIFVACLLAWGIVRVIPDRVIWALRRVLPILSNIAGLLVGLAFVITGFIWMYRGFSWFIDRLGWDLTTGARVVAFGAALLALGLAGKAYMGFMLWAARHVSVLYRIVALDSAADQVRMDAGGRSLLSYLGISRGPWESGPFGIDISSRGKSYREQGEAEGFPAVFPAGVRTKVSLVPAEAEIEILIDVPVRYAELPWEAILSAKRATRPLRWRYRRTNSLRRPFQYSMNYLGPMPVDVSWKWGASHRVLDAWVSGLKKQPEIELNTDPGDYGELSYSAARILYLNRDVRESNRGLTLEPGNGRQIFASEIRQAYPFVKVVIIQLPFKPIPSHTASDRLDAARARRMAAELYEAGVAAVLVLPATVEASGVRALRKIIDVIARRPWRATFELSKAVGEASLGITEDLASLDESVEGNRDAKRELPFDVCWYCSDGLDLLRL